MIEKSMTVGQKLRQHREAAALSQRQVAEALNIDRSTYTRYEIDDTEPNLETLVKLALIFNVPAIELLPDHDSHDSPLRDARGADSPIYQLSKDERSLIALYRPMTAQQKRELRQFIANMSKKD